MKKTFKQSFGVTGTPAQIQAFKEWAESVGWTDGGEADFAAKLFFEGHTENNYPLSKGMFWGTHANTDNKTTYHLPAQWAEAMQAASQTEIVWEKGDWVKTGKGTVRQVDHVSPTRFGSNCTIALVGEMMPNDPKTFNYHVGDFLTPATPEEIEAARKPTFERGEKVVSQHGAIVLCNGNTDFATFGGQVIQQGNSPNGSIVGTSSKAWDKKLFTLYSSPVTL